MKRVSLVVTLALAAGLTAQAASAQTLKTVKDRGQLSCGVSQGLPGFSTPDDKGNWTGLDVDICRAIAAAVRSDHATDHIDLLFNNAGIGGGGSFVADPRDEWDRTFAVCWGGVYNGCRAFMPML